MWNRKREWIEKTRKSRFTLWLNSVMGFVALPDEDYLSPVGNI
jgi:hypothetical protein